jgi:hypothetical protein
MKIIDSKLQGNVLQEFTDDYLEKHKELIKYVKEETKKQLILSDVMRSDCEIEEIVEQNKDYVLGFYTGNELKEYLSNNYA